MMCYWVDSIDGKLDVKCCRLCNYLIFYYRLDRVCCSDSPTTCAIEWQTRRCGV